MEASAFIKKEEKWTYPHTLRTGSTHSQAMGETASSSQLPPSPRPLSHPQSFTGDNYIPSALQIYEDKLQRVRCSKRCTEEPAPMNISYNKST